MKIQLFWDVTLCCLVRCYRRTCHNLQSSSPRKVLWDSCDTEDEGNKGLCIYRQLFNLTTESHVPHGLILISIKFSISMTYTHTSLQETQGFSANFLQSVSANGSLFYHDHYPFSSFPIDARILGIPKIAKGIWKGQSQFSPWPCDSTILFTHTFCYDFWPVKVGSAIYRDVKVSLHKH
jgi:hypothetical protein